ncbi:MAG: DUF4198 domain-containing protein, partial [Candidatus Adiutrix sp.]
MKFQFTLGALFLALTFAFSAHGHEFVIKTDKSAPQQGETVKALFMASHVFSESAEMEELADIQATLIYASGQMALDLKPSPPDTAIISEFTMPTSEPAWLVAHRLPQRWSQTTDGMLAGDAQTLPDKKVLYTNMYEKFTKLLINPAKNDTSFQKPLGQVLEIMVLDNPAEVQVGDEIKVQVLHQGQPISVPIYATYMGFSNQQNTYAYYTEPEEGEPVVKITAPGMWLIRANYKAPGPDG